ncbi:MAG: energy transducer TonB, partial [Cyclobacteriaceae bacterium]|nr:energy transducer TonB [Cyclobacteriaceae bacterium]
EEIEIDLDVEMTEETVIEEVVFEEAPEDEDVDEIFTIVEDQPLPKGGMSAFYQYVQKKLKYPAQARRMGIEGKVFVQFVVDKDGTLTEVTAVKGIGAGCDQEAVRVIEGAPKWKPGKQRGRSVKVRMILPITFKLG